MIASRRSCFVILPLLIGVLAICLLIPFWFANVKDQKEVGRVMNKTHHEIGSIIQQATTSLLLMNSSTTNLAKILSRSLGGTDATLSHIQAKVAPILFEALLTIPRVSQISYIRRDGLFFALHSQADQQIFAAYSNRTSSSKHPSARLSHPWYTQRVDNDTGDLYGPATVFPNMVNETWLQQALNTTNGFSMLGNSWTENKNPLVLNVARVDKIGVVSLGFELKSLLNVFSGIIPFGGGLYLATKDGKVVSEGIPNTRVVVEENATIYFHILKTNKDRVTLRLHYETPKTHFFDVEGTKYAVYSSSLDIIGMQMVYVLALPYDEVQRKMHRHLVMASVLSTLMIFVVVISIAINEMCLRAALIKQKEATQQLERKSKNRSVAFENVSHDMRASLAAIIGSIDILISENHKRPELAADLKIMDSSAKFLQSLLNSILDTGKIEAGKMDLEEKPFELVKVVESVVDLFYPVGIKKQVDVILDVHADLLTKYSQVKGDERRLKQILSNLLSNAIKFTSEGHITIRVRARAHTNRSIQSPTITGSDHGRFKKWRSRLCFGNNDECGGDIEAGIEARCDRECMDFVFEVDDTGAGIAKEERASIFENYVQVKGSEHEFEGTGLGLAIVQSLVRLMGGEISIVDKEPGERGTCFKFNVVFKVSRSDSHVISEDENTNTSSGTNTPFCSPKRIGHNSNSSTVVLFISGDERRKVSQKFLRAHGLKVFATRNILGLTETLRVFRQSQNKACSPSSYLSLGLGYLAKPGRSPRPNGSPKEVPLSALDGTDRATPPGFILLVVDTTRADLKELCKVVDRFRKDSKDAPSRVVWLGYRCMQAHGLDEKQLPSSDVVLPMPLHGSRLYSLIDMLPEFGDRISRTSSPGDQSTSGNQSTPEIQVERQEITRISPDMSPLRGKKVLLVEDNSTLQSIATRILKKNGMLCDTCTNGQEALTFVSKGLTEQKDLGASHILPYDYIIMDCKMPVMDGCEATRRIRLMEKDYGVHIPIIGLTAHEEGEELNKFSKGIDIRVSKPLNEQKLLKVIEDLHSKN